MLSSTVAPIATIVGWSVLPSFLSRLLLKGIYTILPSSKPSNQATASRHARYAYVAVILGYLIHTLLYTYQSVLFDQPNAYHTLGLRTVRQATLQGELWESNLRTHWRGLAKEFHPDRAGSSVSSEAHFVALRSAYEILSDPLKRASHDRFGPDTLRMCAEKCIVYRDYWIRGLQASLGFYIATAVSLAVLTITKTVEYGTYWRYISFFALFATEFLLLVQPSWRISLLEQLPYFKNLTIHQIILVLHQLYVVLNCALSQVGPVLWPVQGEGVQKDLQEIGPHVMKLKADVQLARSEAQQLMRADIQPLLQMAVESAPGKESLALNDMSKQLKEAMLCTLVELRLKGGRDTRKVWNEAVRRQSATPNMDGLQHTHEHQCEEEDCEHNVKVKKEEADDSFIPAVTSVTADSEQPAEESCNAPQNVKLEPKAELALDSNIGRRHDGTE